MPALHDDSVVPIRAHMHVHQCDHMKHGCTLQGSCMSMPLYIHAMAKQHDWVIGKQSSPEMHHSLTALTSTFSWCKINSR